MFKFIALLHLSAVYFAALLHAQPSIFPLTGKGMQKAWCISESFSLLLFFALCF